jgi:hypothetical protein
MALTNSPDIASRRESGLQQSVEERFLPRATVRSPFLIEQELQFLRAEASSAKLVEKYISKTFVWKFQHTAQGSFRMRNSCCLGGV